MVRWAVLGFDQSRAGGLRPSADHCSDHVIGRSIKRLVPKPRGNRPSIAVLARSGERKASDIVMRIERSVFFSGAAMDSMVRDGSVVSSSSQR